MRIILRSLLIISMNLPALLFTKNSSAQMSSGPLSGSVFTDDNATGSYIFSTPANAGASDNNRSSASAIISLLIGNTHYLKASGFGFNIPAGTIIKGVFVEIEKSASNISILATVEDNSVMLIKAGNMVGTDHKLGGSWPGSESYYNYGNSTDLWGTTWTPAEINSPNFGVAFSSSIVGIIGLFPSARIDHIRVTVHYNFIIVPLSIVDFSAITAKDHAAHLQWTTANNNENSVFTIQRLTNGSDWVSLHEQQGDISATNQTYQYSDVSCRDNQAFYRLQIQHASGNISYSSMLRVKFQVMQLTFYPNPASDYIILQFGAEIKSLRCFNADGRQRELKYTQTGNGLYKVDIENVTPGLYILRVNESSGIFLKN